MVGNSRGYTLIEMMIVLFILTAVTGTTFVSYQTFSEQQQTDHFFEKLKKDLYFAQQSALIYHESVVILFDRIDHHYTIMTNNEPIVERKYNKDMTVDGALKVVFNENGNIKKAGTLNFQINGDLYALTFQLGKGRFSIEKK